jgi:ferritin-like metal-binding protein YciE
MAVNNPKDVFVFLLSNVRTGAERTTKVLQEISQQAQDPEVKQAIDARAFVNDKIVATIDQCFKLIGTQPVKTPGKLLDAFQEDFRSEVTQIQSPAAKTLFVLAKANQLINLRIGEFVALVAAADLSGNEAVGLLLETALADKLAMGEHLRRMIRNRIESRIAERIAA